MPWSGSRLLRRPAFGGTSVRPTKHRRNRSSSALTSRASATTRAPSPPRRGQRIYPTVTVQGFDTLGVVGKVLEVRELYAREGEVVSTKVDVSGGYGGGVADVLRADHGKLVSVVEVNSSERSDDPEKNTNIRTQLHFAVADWLKDGGELPEDKKLEAELLTPTYGFDARGRRKVESKDEVKKRLKRSPDRADALALAVYSKPRAPVLQAPTPTYTNYETQSVY